MIFAGVFIISSKKRQDTSPITVKIKPPTIAKIIDVCTALEARSSSFEPKALAITILAPIPKPLKIAWIKKINDVVEPTAANGICPA